MEHILKSCYRIGDKISENPFSITYRGYYIGTDKPVVVKIYKRGTLNSSLIRDMKQKVRDFSLFAHHGIAKLLDGDYGWQGFYYVREWVTGQSLHELMTKGEKLGPDKGCDITDQVLAVLEEAHARGIVHGALKPTNIFVDQQGLVKITDFVIEGEIKESMLPKVVELLQDAKYSSPEELFGRPATQRSDIFSLGLIMLEMVTGKPAPLQDGIRGNIKKLKLPVIVSKEELVGLPRYVSEILCRVLQKDPLLRIPSAKEFRESIEKKNLILPQLGNEELIRVFENIVTQYGGEVIDEKVTEALQDIGKFRLHWSREKHRTWILAVIIGVSVVLGILYSFLFGR
jgi:serine/threonine-protein kinase